MIFNKNSVLPLITISVTCTMNNTVASLINSKGRVLYTLSCGHLKYKGSKKGSPIASQQVVFQLGKQLLTLGHTNCLVIIKGVGKGRNLIVRELIKAGLNIFKIVDSTSIAFNGCRIKKGKN